MGGRAAPRNDVDASTGAVSLAMGAREAPLPGWAPPVVDKLDGARLRENVRGEQGSSSGRFRDPGEESGSPGAPHPDGVALRAVGHLYDTRGERRQLG